MSEPLVSNYPATLDNNTSLGGDQVNIKSFVLGSSIGSSETSIPANAAISGVNVPFYLLADSELIYVESISGSNFNVVVRGAGGTTAASHTSGITLYVVYAANLFNQLKRAIIAIETELGAAPSAGFSTVLARLNDVDSGIVRNYVITPSIASNNLTIAIKTLAGTDPSASDKIMFRIGDTKYELTAATSFTKNAATNWCNLGSSELAAQPADLFVYAIGETGASAGLKFGYSRIPYAKTMGDFVNTSTDEKYIAGNWTNFNSTDKVEVIGRFRAQLSAGAGYTWSIATQVVVNRPIYNTDWLNWIPQFGTNEFTLAPTYSARYSLKDNLLYIAYSGIVDGNAGTATTFTVTLPFISKNVTNHFQYSSLSWLKDNNAVTNTPGTVFTTPNSRVLTLRKASMATWTASVNGKNAAFTVFMEIN